MTRSGEVVVPTVEIVEPKATSKIGGLASNVLSALTFGFGRWSQKRPKLKFSDPGSALISPDLLAALQRMSGIEFADAIDMVQKHVASDFPKFYQIKGRDLRLRIKIKGGEFEPLHCPIFATWSPKAEAIVFTALGTGLQFGEWANRYHPGNKKLVAACDVLAAETILLIARVTTFSARPDYITKFGLV